MKYLLTALLMMIVSQALHADPRAIDPKKKKLVDKMIELTVTEQGKSIPEYYADYFTAKQRKVIEEKAPNSDPKLIKAYEQIANDYLTQQADRLHHRLYYVYDKFYDEEELKTLIQFYSSDLGKKTLAVHTDFRAQIHMEVDHWGVVMERELQLEARKRLQEQGLVQTKQETSNSDVQKK